MEAVGADVELFRPLLPVGYSVAVSAYQQAVNNLRTRDLTQHYTLGLREFHEEFVPRVKARLYELTGGAWRLDDYIAVAAGSDVDFITHFVEAVAARAKVCIYPGDWFGFLVGSTQQQNIAWSTDSADALACLCIPSVRNGHITTSMLQFLEQAPTCLLNLNLYPTLTAPERLLIAESLLPVLPKSVLSISFSRGFGLTVSQLGLAFVHREHPYIQRFSQQWNWLTYFHNTLAGAAFLLMDERQRAAVDEQRRQWVNAWLWDHGLPVVGSGSYYVKSFQLDEPAPAALQPLVRDGVARLCFKPPQV